MDEYGIGSALKSMLEIHARCSRRTGRSDWMISTVDEGDLIVFAERREAERVWHKAKQQRGIEINYVVAPLDLLAVADKIQGRGEEYRVRFDHSWLERYYHLEVGRIVQNLQSFQNQVNRRDPQQEQTAAEAARKFDRVSLWENYSL